MHSHTLTHIFSLCLSLSVWLGPARITVGIPFCVLGGRAPGEWGPVRRGEAASQDWLVAALGLDWWGSSSRWGWGGGEQTLLHQKPDVWVQDFLLAGSDGGGEKASHPVFSFSPEANARGCGGGPGPQAAHSRQVGG